MFVKAVKPLLDVQRVVRSNRSERVLLWQRHNPYFASAGFDARHVYLQLCYSTNRATEGAETIEAEGVGARVEKRCATPVTTSTPAAQYPFASRSSINYAKYPFVGTCYLEWSRHEGVCRQLVKIVKIIELEREHDNNL